MTAQTEHDELQAIKAAKARGVLMISGASDVHWLGHLAGMATARANELTIAAQDLSRSCDDKDDAEHIFTALRRFEAALREAREYAEEVTSHAVSRHGYY